MAKFESSPESSLITRSLSPVDGVNREFVVDLGQSLGASVWSLSPKEEGSLGEFHNGPWGFVVDRRSGDRRIKRNEIFVLMTGLVPKGYLEIDNVYDTSGEYIFHIREF